MNFLNKKYLIISVVGSHAGEKVLPIFLRKQEEIKLKSKTYWLLKSFKARTSQIQSFCKQAQKENEDIYCLFIQASTKTGARPTLRSFLAKYMFADNIDWESIPRDVRITGKIDKQSTALVLDELVIPPGPFTIDLWSYSDSNNEPIKLQLGASTICCKDASSIGMKSRIRNVMAWGRLSDPYAVWLK